MPNYTKRETEYIADAMRQSAILMGILMLLCTGLIICCVWAIAFVESERLGSTSENICPRESI